MVGLSACVLVYVSVCQLDMADSAAKTAKRIDMPRLD